MNFDEYQKKSRKTAIYPDLDKNFVYPTLGLIGEAGEIAEKIKKVFRDENGRMTDEKRKELEKELGDVLWYLHFVSHYWCRPAPTRPCGPTTSRPRRCAGTMPRRAGTG